METRTLGTSYGCMGLEAVYGPATDRQAGIAIFLARSGAPRGKTSVEAFERLVASDFQKWSSLARARGISVN